MAKYARKRAKYSARRRTPLDQLDPLVRELVRIGADGFQFSLRAKEIGKLLDHRGGIAEMRAAHEQVSNWHPDQARALERAWGGIGDWLS
ncbi:hypothetical protein [Kribbella alba]|uniref:hypothetical protein n=1 Tax=Kribbella alba TaxID=190197 RepID=UPI0031D967A2